MGGGGRIFFIYGYHIFTRGKDGPKSLQEKQQPNRGYIMSEFCTPKHRGENKLLCGPIIIVGGIQFKNLGRRGPAGYPPLPIMNLLFFPPLLILPTIFHIAG